jgi:Flp pilus assembly protein protease CpaA
VALIALSVSDVAYRRVSNTIAASALLLGLSYWTMRAGAEGFVQSGLGALIVAGALLPSYVRGWMGAGDVKAGAGIGALLTSAVLVPFACGTLAATLLASLVILSVGERLTVQEIGQRVRAPHGSLARARAGNSTLPFALCLSAGAAWAARGGLLWLLVGR